MLPFGIQVVLYLFLAGVAAGAGLWGSYRLAGGGSSQGGRRAIEIALACALLGSLFLALDLTRPQDFFLVLTEANSSSAISWGARILVSFILAGFFVRVAAGGSGEDSSSSSESGLSGWDLVGLWFFRITALGLAIYPGFVLQQGDAFPLWQHPLLIPLIAVSALHAGILIPAVFAKSRNEKPAQRNPERKWEIVFGCLQFVILGALLFQTSDSLLLWIVALTLGTLLPLVMVIRRPCCHLRVRLFFILLGLFAMRYWVVMSGQII